ncbi:MAG: hypothetical protein ABSE79_09245 [Terriglobia bacterium]|jgi:hypothetical protein
MLKDFPEKEQKRIMSMLNETAPEGTHWGPMPKRLIEVIATLSEFGPMDLGGLYEKLSVSGPGPDLSGQLDEINAWVARLVKNGAVVATSGPNPIYSLREEIKSEEAVEEWRPRFRFMIPGQEVIYVEMQEFRTKAEWEGSEVIKVIKAACQRHKLPVVMLFGARPEDGESSFEVRLQPDGEFSWVPFFESETYKLGSGSLERRQQDGEFKEVRLAGEGISKESGSFKKI